MKDQAETPPNLKADWSVTRLGAVADVVAGQSPKSSAYNDQGEGLPFYQGKKDFTDRFLAPPTTWTTHVTKRAEAGDILMSVRAPVGPINEATEAICIGRGLAAIRGNQKVDRGYLWYALLWLRPKIVGSEGAVFASINKKSIESFEIPLPPLEEQKRIVARLDQAFAALDRARAHAEANLADAAEVFERSAAALFDRISRAGVPCPSVSAIAERRKGSIRTGPFGSQLKHSEFVDEGICVLGIDNAVQNEFRWGKPRHITPEKYASLSRYRVNPGDVIITIMGTCGRCAIIPDDIPKAINTKHLCCITLDRSKCLPEYLHRYFLLSPKALAYLSAQTKGTVMDGLNMGIIKELPVDLPPLDEQKKICERVEEIERNTRTLFGAYSDELADIADLRQSLLQKAFSGQLT